jgi:hypothetical protein
MLPYKACPVMFRLIVDSRYCIGGPERRSTAWWTLRGARLRTHPTQPCRAAMDGDNFSLVEAGERGVGQVFGRHHGPGA